MAGRRTLRQSMRCVMNSHNRATVRKMAKQKYQKVKMLTNDVTIVAALYIPEDRVYFGTIAHGAGEAMFVSTASRKAPKL
jgi:hypothetical protein